METPAINRSSGKLAIYGGSPTVQDPDLTAWKWPVYGQEEKDAVNEVLNRDWRKIYADIPVFEEELCAYFGSKYAISTNNGTSALNAAAFAVGLQPGDEVICPSYTFWATCTLCRAVGAVPVFADILLSDAGIDASDIRRKITAKTKAISLVHLWGMPAEMDSIMEVAREHDLRVIEDCSHAHGAEYKGRKIGTFGDAGCFSMQHCKLLPAMEGGFFLTNDYEVYCRALAYGHYNRIPKDHEWQGINSTGLGNKHRIHPLAIAIARVKLRELDRQNDVINTRVDRVKERLAALPGLTVFPTPSHVRRTYFQFEVVYDEKVIGVDRDRLADILGAEGARVTAERYPLQHLQEVYQRPEFWTSAPHIPGHLPHSEHLHNSVLQLPIFGHCEEHIVDDYIAAFEKVWANLDQIREDAGEVSKSTGA